MLKIKILKKMWVMEIPSNLSIDPYESHVLIIKCHLSFKSTTLISSFAHYSQKTGTLGIMIFLSIF